MGADSIPFWDTSATLNTSECWANYSSNTNTALGVYGYLKWNNFGASTDKWCVRVDGNHKVQPGTELELPDGARLIVDSVGNYRIEEKDAKVTYQSKRVREWSPHLNASDMVSQFVDYVRTLGVQQSDVLGLPLELFINWLIIEAAERDGDAVPGDVVPVKDAVVPIVHPRCLACGRFIPRIHLRHRFPFCGPDDAVRYLRRLECSQKRITA